MTTSAPARPEARPDCPTCGGRGRVPRACPDGRPGCLVAHYRYCHTCRPEPHAPDMYCGCDLCATAIAEIGRVAVAEAGPEERP